MSWPPSVTSTGVQYPRPAKASVSSPFSWARRTECADALYGAIAEDQAGNALVRKDDWKLIKYDGLEGKVRETQLFNLKDNPHEFLAESHQAKIKALSGAQPKKGQRNLANDPKHAAKLKEMEALLLSEMKRLDDPHRFWDQQAE